MRLRDEVEATLRSWDAYERDRGTPAIIDYDCYPQKEPVVPARSRLEVLNKLQEVMARTSTENDGQVLSRLRNDITYLRALLGERLPLHEYIEQTQECKPTGWPEQYILARGEQARASLEALDIAWDAESVQRLAKLEGRLSPDAAAAAIRHAATELEPLVRKLVGTEAPFNLTIETADMDVYWAYWLDGIGENARLRLNLRRAQFTEVQARIFALHEVLGHALKGASYAARCAREDVPWVRFLSVHAHQQVLLEGLAQALPLFVVPDDKQMTARVRLTHFSQLVQAELHIAINDGVSIEECVKLARSRVPFWSDEFIGDVLNDRSVNPQLRCYLWAYPAGVDWFVSLAEQGGKVAESILRAAYSAPLSTRDLESLWPEGPRIGGPGPSA